ncbi:MAG: alpha/beta hydrolase, partial [Acidobacteriota bacterium]|nr:alpha/beta hydrolase [Acidobacteriota bacterium]
DATPELRSALLRSIARHTGEMAAVSPAAQLAGLRVPVYLLHGEGDNVIPAAESEWLAREIPAAQLRATLVSPAISHVEAAGKPTLADQWRLVHFLARVLENQE